MTEKEKLLQNLIEKSGKKPGEIEKLVNDKVNELSGLVSIEGAIYIVANELEVRLDSEKPKKEANFQKIDKITEPKTPVSLQCKVIRKYDRVTFSSSSGNEGAVQSLLVGDESGIIRIVFWNDKTELVENIHEGDILKVSNAYTRENANSERIEIHYGQYSDLEVNPKRVKIEMPEYKASNIEFTHKKIADLEENERNIKLAGMITDFDIPRFYLACPECFKKVFQDDGTQKCAIHEEVKAIRVPIVNIVIDDGSSSIVAVGFRDKAEAITKSKADEIISLTENIEKYQNFSKKMIGSKVELGGNISENNMTGEKQFLINQVLSLEIKTVEEITEELVKEEKSKPKKENKVKEIEEDDIDVEIEEIDFDDDML